MARCKDCVHWDDGKCKTENRIKEYAEENCGEYVPVSITKEIFKTELENEDQRYLVRMLLKQIYCLKQELILCGSIMERSQCLDKITEMVRDDCLERIRRIIL